LPVGSAGTRQHLAYLQYQKGHNQSDALLYGPGVRDLLAFAARAKQDPHQFRIIVSPQEQLGDHRTAFIAALMRQMERDVGRSLEWLAADHYDTAHAHTHIAIRGVANGQPLYLAKSYFEHGIRDRAEALLTRMLGPTQQERQGYQLAQADTHERITLPSMAWERTRSHALAGQLGSYRQEDGVDGVQAALAQMQQRLQGLSHPHQRPWHQAQRRVS
jgi:type IV secretory pathway VirD2 relaxase